MIHYSISLNCFKFLPFLGNIVFRINEGKGKKLKGGEMKG